MESVTSWLELRRDGDPEAMQRLTALIYQDLRRSAAYHLKAESDAFCEINSFCEGSFTSTMRINSLLYSPSIR